MKENGTLKKQLDEVTNDYEKLKADYLLQQKNHENEV